MSSKSTWLEQFDASSFAEETIYILGAGSVGSAVADALARIGIRKLRVYDPDRVAEHNVTNQLYGMPHIGLPKSYALGEILGQQLGITIDGREAEAGPETGLGRIVFMCLEPMQVRRRIWDAMKYNGATELLVEVRIMPDQGRVYTVNPQLPSDIVGWEANWYDDPPAPEPGHCGRSRTARPIVMEAAAKAVLQFMQWAAFQAGQEEEPPAQELLFFVRPWRVYANRFGAE